MKKAVAILLTIALCVTMVSFAGCGEETKPSDVTTTTESSGETTTTQEQSAANDETTTTVGENDLTTTGVAEDVTTTAKGTTTTAKKTTTTVKGTTTAEKTTTTVKGTTTTAKKTTTTVKSTTTAAKKTTTTTTKVSTTTKPTTTTTQATTTTLKPVSGSLTVLDEPFDSFLISDNPDIIPGERNGKWGAIKSDGSIHIPFEYDGMQIQADGYIIMRKATPVMVWGEEQNKIDSYLFDASGNMLLHTTQTPVELHDLETGYKGDYISSYRAGVVLTYENDIVEGPCDEKRLCLRKPDGTLIKSFESVVSFVPMDNGHTVITYPVGGESWGHSVAVIDQAGNIVKKKENGFSFSDMLFSVDVKGVAGGYLCLNFTPSTSWVLVDFNDFDKRYYFNRDSDDNWFAIRDYYGTFIVAESENGGYGLFDLSKITAPTATDPDNYAYLQISQPGCITNKLYDKISIASYFGRTVDYVLIQEGEKWGYLSLDGTTKKLFDDATSFYGDYAMVKEQGKCYVIDKTFKKVSVELTGYDSVGAICENLFGVEKNGKYYPVIYTP